MRRTVPRAPSVDEQIINDLRAQNARLVTEIEGLREENDQLQQRMRDMDTKHMKSMSVLDPHIKITRLIQGPLDVDVFVVGKTMDEFERLMFRFDEDHIPVHAIGTYYEICKLCLEHSWKIKDVGKLEASKDILSGTEKGAIYRQMLLKSISSKMLKLMRKLGASEDGLEHGAENVINRAITLSSQISLCDPKLRLIFPRSGDAYDNSIHSSIYMAPGDILVETPQFPGIKGVITGYAYRKARVIHRDVPLENAERNVMQLSNVLETVQPNQMMVDWMKSLRV